MGGGGDVRGLSDEALEWTLQGARKAGLKLDTTSVSKIYGIQPGVLAKLDNTAKFNWNPKAVGALFATHYSSPRAEAYV